MAVGDINGDSYEDLAVGGPGEDNNAGTVLIYFGSDSGFQLGEFVKQGDAGGASEAGDVMGTSVAVGDFNGDGFADLAAGGPGENGGIGVVFVWRGSADGVDQESGVFYFAADLDCGANEPGDEFGFALTAADFNADGFDDLAIGVPGEDNDQGVICVVLGAPNGFEDGNGTCIRQSSFGAAANEAGDRFGASLASAPMSSGPHADLVVGAPGEDIGGSGPGAGSVSVLYAQNSAVPGTLFADGILLSQEDAGGVSEEGDQFGISVGVGDIDGDGIGDLVVGASGETRPGGRSGAVFRFLADAGGVGAGGFFDQSNDVAGVDNEDDDRFGASVTVGDLNDDGFGDVIVGAPGKGVFGAPANAGMVVAFASDGDLTLGEVIDQTQIGGGNEGGDLFGAALASGDFNGDGADDIAIGVPGEAPFSDPASGFVYLIYGVISELILTHGPVLGSVSDTRIKIWARASRESLLEVAYRPSGGGPETTLTTELRAEDDKTGVVAIDGLSPSTEYDYRVLLDGVERFAGVFTTLSPVGEPAVVRFVVGADLVSNYRPFTVFDAALATDPDFMLAIGDNMYADIPSTIPDSKEAYEGRYRANWSDPPFRNFMQQVPMFLTWDDHEIICNFWPGKTPRYVNARLAYDEYQASINPAPRSADDLYYSFRVGEIDFYVFDTRSHRSPNTDPDGPVKTMLGDAQLADFLGWLDASTAKLKVVVSSVPFNDWSTTADDSWHGAGNSHGAFLSERTTIFDHIRDNAISGVFLISGDQHCSGVFRLGAVAPYELYEFMPTPLAIGARQAPAGNPEILHTDDVHRVFGLFEIDTTVSPATLLYQLISDDGEVLFELPLTEDDIGL